MKKRILFSAMITAIFLSACINLSVNAASTDYPRILDSSVMTSENNTLRYIPNTYIEENFMQEIYFFQNQLLSACYIYDTKSDSDFLQLRLLSSDTGELLHETQIQIGGSYTTSIQICEDQISVNDAVRGTIHVLDSTLKETAIFSVSGDMIYVNPSLTKAYCFSNTNGICIVDLTTNETQTMLENARDLTLYSCIGTDISIRYIDSSSPDKKECYAGLNLESGEVEFFETDISFSGLHYHSGFWAGSMLAEDNTYFAGTQKNPYQFNLELSYPSLQLTENPSHLIFSTTEADGTQSLTAYQTDGIFLSSFSLSSMSGTPTSQTVWNENAQGYFLIIIDETGHDKLYFWDLSEHTEGTPLSMIPYEQKKTAPGSILDAQYYSQAQTLSEEYGVSIKIADQCAVDYYDKTVSQEYDTAKITTAFQTLQKAFASYPDNFWKQLRYGTYREIEINLMGDITNKEYIEGYSPSAFVQHTNGKIIMVLNINIEEPFLEQNFYHESSHIIDKVLEHDALYREEALYSEEKWSSLNPKEFISLNPDCNGYYYSYAIMPMDYYQEIFTSYFASDYGKSFPTEDRATIFEAAMNGTTQIFSRNVSAPLYSKLEYYCQCIRDCFNTSGWPEYTAWEMALQES